MNGQDQSRNLSGMLGQIAETVGGMGEAYAPVMKEATRPRGDMNDPQHLQRLAQWASSNGDSAGASMYMQQARTLQSEQKEQRSMENMAMTDKATMTGNMTAQQIASQGDVTNLDRSIASLRERMQGEFPSVQARNYAKQNLERLESMRADAVTQQNVNHAQAVTSIDKALADTSTPPEAQTALRARKEELLKDPDVQKALNAQKLEAFRAKQAQDAMEEQAFLEKNMPALRDAVGDPARADEIIASAPVGAQDSLRQTFNAMKTFQDSIDAQTKLFDDVALPTQMDLIDIQVNGIPEELRSGPASTAEKLRQAEAGRDKDGRPLTAGHATAIKNARDAHTKALLAAQNAIGQQEYARRRAAEVKLETEVEDLRNQRETFRPSDDAIRTRARVLAEQNDDYVTRGQDRRGKGGRTDLNIGAYLNQAASELRNEHRSDIDKQIALRTGEEIPVEETATAEGWTNPNGNTITQATVDRGLEKVGKKRFVEKMREEGYQDEQIAEMIGESIYDKDDLKEVDPYRAGGRVSEYTRSPNTLHGVRVRPASEIYG